jgi:glycosyltransferase involved in cell wall biosynthesis
MPKGIFLIEASNVPRLIEQIKNAAVGAPLNHLVVAPSKLIFREQLARNIPKRKIRLIPLGVEAPKLQSDRSIARSQLTISQGELCIVSFARLVPHKGIDVLIEAVKLLPEDCRTRLKVFIGGIGNQREYEQLLNNSDRKIIHFVGHVDNTDRFYAAADLFVLPSRHEPFGLVFVEAAHYGVPSIGTRVGGVSEAIEDGHTGLIVPPESPGELSRAIERLIRNPTLLEKLGAAAQARARKFFSEEVMLGGYAKIYDEVLGLKKQNSQNQEHQIK